MINNQDEFTARLEESLEVLAIEQSKVTAAQIAAMVADIQNGQHTRASLFFESADVPDEWIDMASEPGNIQWAVLVNESNNLDRWAQHGTQTINLPDGKTIVLGYSD